MADLFSESEITSCTDVATNPSDLIDDPSVEEKNWIILWIYEALLVTSIPSTIEILVTLALMLSIDVE